MKCQAIKRMFGKRFRSGSYSAFASVLVIILVILANLMFSALPTSVTELDMTTSSLYTLSEQSKLIVSSIDKDVDLYLLAITGNEDETISRLLDRYAGLSDHIKVTYMDPTVNPTFLNAYDLSTTNLYANSVLVDCNGRFRLVSYSDIYVTEYSMDYYSYSYTSTTTFDGENALTGAIHYVTSDNLPKVYTLTGHGEDELADSITEMFEQDNIELDEISLLSLEEMPEDMSALLIYAPDTDLGDEEADLLIAWLEKGGNIVLLTDYMETSKMPNLLRVTAAMGLTAQDGLIIEGDSSMRMNRYPYYLLPTLGSHDIVSPISESRYSVMTVLSQPIAETDNSDADVSWLLTTSSSAYLKADGMNTKTTAQEDSDTVGSFHVGAAAEYGDSKLVWISSSEFVNESVNRTVSGANGDLLLNAFNWMCEQEESISIRAKSLDRDTLTVTSSESSFWSIIMIGVLPAFCLVCGITIWVRRKRR